MFVAQYYTPDCPSEDDGKIILKAKTLDDLAQRIANETYAEESEDELTYDDNYFYIGNRPCFKIQKI